VALDSAPQGATVVAASDGHRLGETPLLLNLPRGQTTMEIVLHKAGFAPLPFKVIPHQDKDVVARLEALPPPSPPPPPPKAKAKARHANKRPPLPSGPAQVPGRTAPPVAVTRSGAKSVPPPRSAGPAIPPRPAAPTAVPPRPVATIPTTRR
jgi:hypothetical protein